MTAPPAPLPKPHRDSLLATLTNYLIVSAMLTCVAVGMIQLGEQIAPAWNASYIPFLCFLVALESAAMTRYLHTARPPVPWYVLRAVEVVVLFLIIRSLLGILRGPQFGTDIQLADDAVDGELIALTIIAGITWLLSWQFTHDLLALETIDPLLEREALRDVDNMQATSQQSLISLTAIVGVALVFLAALIRVHLRNTGHTEQATVSAFAHVLLYFLLGLILLSKTRLALLRAGWTWEQIPIGSGVGARWATYTVLLLTGITLIAVILPTQYSLGLLGTLSYLFRFIIALIEAIFFFIVGIFYALVNLFIPPIDRQPFQPPPLTLGVPPRQPDVPQLSISEFAQSLIFWIVFFAVVGYVLYQYLHQHPELLARLQRLPGISWLTRLWQRLREWFGGLNKQFEDLLEARRRARRPTPTRAGQAVRPGINPRRLSPRQQVQFYYLAMLRRSGEKGHARRPTQTPYEYAQALQSQLPEIDQDVDGLTDEFIEARYSRHEITLEHVSLARRYWERIKRALKRRPSSS